MNEEKQEEAEDSNLNLMSTKFSEVICITN